MIDINKSIQMWIEECYVDLPTVINNPAPKVYEFYRCWCMNTCTRMNEIAHRKAFYRKLREYFNLDIALRKDVDGFHFKKK